MNSAKTVKNTALLLGATVGAAIGGWDGLTKWLVICMAVDYISGLMVAANGKSPKTEGGGISSKVSFAGLCRKMLIILLLIIANYGDIALGVNYLRNAACYFFIGNEGISILENASLLDLGIPPKLKEVFELMKDKGKGDGDA